jgi:hypothetical protein
MSKIALSLAAIVISAPVAFAQIPPCEGNYSAAVKNAMNCGSIVTVPNLDNILTGATGVGGRNAPTVTYDTWDIKSGR